MAKMQVRVIFNVLDDLEKENGDVELNRDMMQDTIQDMNHSEESATQVHSATNHVEIAESKVRRDTSSVKTSKTVMRANNEGECAEYAEVQDHFSWQIAEYIANLESFRPIQIKERFAHEAVCNTVIHKMLQEKLIRRVEHGLYEVDKWAKQRIESIFRKKSITKVIERYMFSLNQFYLDDLYQHFPEKSEDTIRLVVSLNKRAGTIRNVRAGKYEVIKRTTNVNAE